MTEKTPELLCTNCHKPVTDEMNLCPYCGHQLKAGTYQAQPPPQVIVVPQAAAPPAAAPMPTAAAPPQKKQNAWGLLLKAGFRFALGYVLVLGLSYLYTEYKPQVQPFLPFVGGESAEAAGVAWNYVNEYYPDFRDAERTVSAVRVDGEPYYVVDFTLVSSDTAQTLRMAVSRDLQDTFVLEYYNSDASWSADNE